MEMTPDAIKEIERMALAGQPRIVKVEHLSEDYYAVQADGKVEVVELPADPPNITAHSEAGFTDAITRLMEEPMSPAQTATVYVGRSHVLALCDKVIGTDLRHAGRVGYRLATSKAMLLIEQAPKMTHQQLCHALRTTWYNMIEDDVVSRLETVKQSSSKTGKSTFKHGTEGMGGELTREVLGEAELPNTVEITTPFYENASAWARVVAMECVLDITWDNEIPCFRLEPRAEEMASAQSLALAQIVDAIKKIGASWCVLAGTPTV